MNRTDCTAAHADAQRLFSFFSRKKVVGDFARGELSSDAGLPLLRQLDERLGLSRRRLRCLDDRRHPSYVEHEVAESFRQPVYQIACGYEHGNDAERLGHHPTFRLSGSEKIRPAHDHSTYSARRAIGTITAEPRS